ncbi:MAG: cyclic nucleotide-binding domain-containing protein [Vampirovibrio sp.]|nr:cyclic nucleotide-binding domain-containing protein [Vampirovibrio sp.]
MSITKSYIKGETIIKEGAKGDRTFQIISGEVLICKEMGSQGFIPIAKLGPGEYFGEMYLWEKNSSRTASAIATTDDVTLEIIFQDEMEAYLDRLPDSLQQMIFGMNRRLKTTSVYCAARVHEDSFSFKTHR